MKLTPWSSKEESLGQGIKSLKEYVEDKLSVAGFDFMQQNSDIIAWPEGSKEDVVYLRWHEPGAYSVVDGEGFFKLPGRQKAFQNQLVNWVYEYYSGGAYRFR